MAQFEELKEVFLADLVAEVVTQGTNTKLRSNCMLCQSFRLVTGPWKRKEQVEFQ